MLRSARWIAMSVWLALTLAPVAELVAQTATAQFDGRWAIAADVWFSGLAVGGRGGGARGGRGGAPGAGDPGPEVVIDITARPGGFVSGVAMGITGRRGAPGSHPPHPVEITKGQLRGDTLHFEIWRFDGFHNRLYVEARAEGNELALTFRQDTPDGPDTFTARARRADR